MSDSSTQPAIGEVAQEGVAEMVTSDSTTITKKDADVSDAAVLAYLRKHGLANAESELKALLQKQNGTTDNKVTHHGLSDKESEVDSVTVSRSLVSKEQFQTDEEQRTSKEASSSSAIHPNTHQYLTRSTGGGLGYDLDHAASLPTWGSTNAIGSEQHRLDEDAAMTELRRYGCQEAKLYIESFDRLQTWVLGLPEDGSKPELLSVTFPLLAHAVCELLECGMESDAKALLQEWQAWYQPLYDEPLRELKQCHTTAQIVAWSAKVLHLKEAHGELRRAQLQLAALQRPPASSTSNPSEINTLEAKVKEGEVSEWKLRQEVEKPFTFLYRLRTSRLPIRLSQYSYSLLMTFLSQESLIPMSVLLMTKCQVEVENRPPAPRTPAIVLEALELSDSKSPLNMESKTDTKESLVLDAPYPRPAADLYGVQKSASTTSPAIPSPLNSHELESRKALILHGFRRLEALEALNRSNDETTSHKARRVSVQADLKKGNQRNLENRESEFLDLMTPSILVATFGDSSFSVNTQRPGAASMQEAGVEITSTRFSPDDGRRVAVGGDDSIVRVWRLDSLDAHPKFEGESGLSESCTILIGHKNGWPVFGVDWCRDGRSLLSCSGDGTVRLWDTSAVGSKGTIVRAVKKKTTTTPTNKHKVASSSGEPSTRVQGLKEITQGVEVGGAALSVYYGHCQNTAVWDCKFAPSGYYFASCGGDATAQIWTTDRTSPVRSLVGHHSSVNCVTWHPNVNYVLTGSDDKTCRLFDIQSGKCVRLLTGFHGWISAVEVSPDGQYAATADSLGNVATFELASGRKVCDFDSLAPGNNVLAYNVSGSVLAGGGDGCVVKFWETNKTISRAPRQPLRVFPSKGIMFMDLLFTKRNLLMCAGKFCESGIMPLI